MIKEYLEICVLRDVMTRPVVYDVECKPVYGRHRWHGMLYIRGWKVRYKAIEYKIFPNRLDTSVFFKETWFRNSERAATQFKNKLLLRFNKERFN